MSPSGSVLALAPVYRGVGFIVFDEQRNPLDWGVKETRTNKLETCRQRVGSLLALHRPHTVILERTDVASCRRRRRIRELIAVLASLAQEHGSSVVHIERTAIAVLFHFEPRASKDALASAIAAALPALSHRVPTSRRVWESEKHSMALFEAAGLALAHFAAAQKEPTSAMWI